MACSLDNSIPRELIVAALEGILASREFRNSPRKRRFVQFVVNETLAGHSDHIKAYTIALDVFDRDASFDPMLDPIVRIQAGRIRRSLERYYDTEGADDRVRITIPKGSYVPYFDLMTSHVPRVSKPQTANVARNRAPLVQDAWSGSLTPDAPDTPAATFLPPSMRIAHAIHPRIVLVAAAVLVFMATLLVPVMLGIPFGARSARQEPSSFGATRAPTLMVLPFTNGTGNPALDIVADGLTEDLVGALVRSQKVRVFGADKDERALWPQHKAMPDVPMDYVLQGSINQSGEQIQVTTVLSDGRNRRYLWADDMRREVSPDTMIILRQDISLQLAGALTQQNGVLDTEEARGSATHPSAALPFPECGTFRTLMSWIGLATPC